MSRIREAIREIHRRSLWQVLGIFVVASWGVLQVIDVVTEAAGLPDWTPSMAFVLLLIGLPICLATAFVQEGLPGRSGEGPAEGARGAAGEGASTDSRPAINLAPGTGSLDRPSTRPHGARRFLTWRNAVVGGVAALVLLGGSVTAYFVMWSTGIGPMGNLVAQGAIEEGDRVVLADFEDATGEGLGLVVSGALRVDLVESEVLDLIDPADLEPALRRMRVEPGAILTSAVAREVAVREGLEAVLEGIVRPAGTGYVITAALLEAETGRAVASFRVSAADESEIIGTIDALSQDIREKSGESLKEIRAGEPLARATTASLEALRAYTEAARLFGTNEATRTRELLERAVALDSTFVQAWLQLAFHLSNNTTDIARADEAYENAYRLRDAVPDAPRYFIEGAYHGWRNDNAAAIEAYQNLLRIAPEQGGALNNLANRLSAIGEREQARELFRRAITLPSRGAISYGNLVNAELFFGEVEAAAQILSQLEAEYPDFIGLDDIRIAIALLAGSPDRAEQTASAVLNDPTLPLPRRIGGAAGMARVAYRRGQIESARAYAARAIAMAEQVDPSLASVQRILAGIGETLFGDVDRASADVLSGMRDGVLDPDALPENLAVNLFYLLNDDDLADLIENVDLSQRSTAFAVGNQQFRQRATELGPRAALTELRGLLGCETDLCLRMLGAFLAIEAEEWEMAVEMLEPIQGSEYGLPITGYDDLYAIVQLGPAYEGAGRTEDAIAAYQRVIELWRDADEEGRVVVRRYEERVRELAGR